MNKDNEEKNKSCIKYDHNAGNKILVTNPISIKSKLHKAKEGTFIITRLYQNIAAQIQKGAINETLSLQRIISSRD